MTRQTLTKKIHLISLGCSRNRVDSEVMLGTLLEKGWAITEDPEKAAVIIVNTCCFIEPAKQESVDHILEAASYKEKNPELKLVVSGCLSQRYQNDLATELPEVDLFVGTDEFPRIAELVEKLYSRTQDGSLEKVHIARSRYLYDGTLPRLNTLGKGSAYVKVAEGCQHSCSFCVIPAIRGPLRSRTIESAVREAKGLAKQGVVEINLIAQDITAFGRDRKNKNGETLANLIRSLAGVEGLQWIRLLYAYPEFIDDEFLNLLQNENKLVKYLDVPVQHASDKILKMMNRKITRRELTTIFRDLRSAVPDIALRTSVMVGFPGETEADFDALEDFVAETGFDHLGCFTYSREEGTRAAKLPGQITEKVKRSRQAKIMKLQQKISRKLLKRYVGQVMPVLVEGPHEESPLLWRGRLPTQAPEVDGCVIINEGRAPVGTIRPVKITEVHDYDLVGTIES